MSSRWELTEVDITETTAANLTTNAVLVPDTQVLQTRAESDDVIKKGKEGGRKQIETEDAGRSIERPERVDVTSVHMG